MGYGETAIVHHKQDFNITELSLSHASNCLLLGRVEAHQSWPIKRIA